VRLQRTRMVSGPDNASPRQWVSVNSYFKWKAEMFELPAEVRRAIYTAYVIVS
jgi:hypothetical protein